MIAAALPLLLVEIPPVLDWTAHFVRLSLLAEGNPGPVREQFWTIDPGVRPNLAMEAVVLPLAKLIGVRAAFDVFLVSTLALWIIGPVVLHHAIWNRWGPESLFAWAFALNGCYFVGLYNFLFGAGLGFFVLTVAVSNRLRPAPAAIAETLLFTAMWFSHLMAMAVFAVLRVALEIGRPAGDRPGSLGSRLTRLAPVFLPAILLTTVFNELSSDAPLSFNLLANVAAPFIYASRAGGVIDPLPTLAVGLVAYLGRRRGRISIAPIARLPLLVAAAMMLAAPSEIASGAMVHWRMAPILGALFVSAWKLEPDRARIRIAALVGSVFVILATLFQTVIWRRASVEASAARTALAANVLPGEKILPVATRADAVTYLHLAEMAVLDASAFVPTLFTTKGQSPIRLTPRAREIGATSAREGASLPVSELEVLADAPETTSADVRSRRRPYLAWQTNFDLVFVTGPGAEKIGSPPFTTLRAAGQGWSLWRVDEKARGPKGTTAPRSR